MTIVSVWPSALPERGRLETILITPGLAIGPGDGTARHAARNATTNSIGNNRIRMGRTTADGRVGRV